MPGPGPGAFLLQSHVTLTLCHSGLTKSCPGYKSNIPRLHPLHLHLRVGASPQPPCSKLRPLTAGWWSPVVLRCIRPACPLFHSFSLFRLQHLLPLPASQADDLLPISPRTSNSPARTCADSHRHLGPIRGQPSWCSSSPGRLASTSFSFLLLIHLLL